MKHLLIIAAIALTFGLSQKIGAKPFCDGLLDTTQLPAKYARRGPFYSDDNSGWIVPRDQLKTDFNFTRESADLLENIVKEFGNRGIALGVLALPPRALLIPAKDRANLFPIGLYDTQQAQEDFVNYIKTMQNMGIFTADLLTAAKTELPDDFYFLRDSHWTPQGVALAMTALAQEASPLLGNGPGYEGLDFEQEYIERGSFRNLVKIVCGLKLPAESVKATSYAKQGGAAALLSDAPEPGPRIALVGTSFSDRYQRDAYQAADALAHATSGTVENYSLTGGGLVSAMEAFILGGNLQSGRYAMVVWEVPYTASLTDLSCLRQILGALQSLKSGPIVEVFSGNVGSDWLEITHAFTGGQFKAINIQASGKDIELIVVEMYDQQGKKTRIKLRKSNRIPPDLVTNSWTASLAGLESKNFMRIRLKVKSSKDRHNLSLRLLQ